MIRGATQIWSRGNLVITAPAKDGAPYRRRRDETFLDRRSFSQTVLAWPLEHCLHALATEAGGSLKPDITYLIPYGLCRMERAHIVLIVIVDKRLYVLNSQPAWKDSLYLSNLTEIATQFGLEYQNDQWINYGTQGVYFTQEKPVNPSHLSSLFSWLSKLKPNNNCPYYAAKLIQTFLSGALEEKHFLEGYSERQTLLRILKEHASEEKAAELQALKVSGGYCSSPPASADTETQCQEPASAALFKKEPQKELAKQDSAPANSKAADYDDEAPTDDEMPAIVW